MRAVRENPRGLVDVASHEPRAPAGSAEAEPPEKAPADEVRADGVAYVVSGDDETRDGCADQARGRRGEVAA
jgi:hypothetical protein